MSLHSSYFQVKKADGEGTQQQADKQLCTRQAWQCPAATPRGGHLWLCQQPFQDWVKGGENASHSSISVQSPTQEISLCYSAGSFTTFFLEGQGFKFHPRSLAAPQRQYLPCHERWIIACSGKETFFSLVLSGKWGAEEQEWHHITHLSLIQKLQRTPIWNWHNCHPVAGTSKKKGKIELPAPMLHHLLKSALSSDFVSTTRMQARMAQNGGRSALPEWGSRGPQLQNTKRGTQGRTCAEYSLDELFLQNAYTQHFLTNITKAIYHLYTYKSLESMITLEVIWNHLY